MNNIQYDYIEEYINNTHKGEEPFFADLRKYAESNHIHLLSSEALSFHLLFWCLQ